MSIVAYIFCVINLVLAVISFVPCLMAGGMSMDSPQAQKDPFAITLCILILSFPIVCLLCGILTPITNYFKWHYATVFFCVLPLLEAASVIGLLLVFGEK